MRFHHVKKLIQEEQDLFEINMSPSSLEKLTKKIDARAGMEFEMIVPDINVDDADNFESEPDYDQDEGVSSFSDIMDFFRGEHNTRNEVQRVIDEMESEFLGWEGEYKMKHWDEDQFRAIKDYIRHEHGSDLKADVEETMSLDYPNMDTDSEEYKTLSRELFKEKKKKKTQEALEEQNDDYDSAYEEWEEEWNDDYDDLVAKWLDEQGYNNMSDISNSYNLEWPHWTEYEGGDGDPDINNVADSFSHAVGKPINASTSYHGATRSPGRYVVEPDGSLEPDEYTDYGLEFVSPPMPIEEMFSDLDKVKRWADNRGCYTNESTGLHINVSVPGYDLRKLDYVKLALLMGDKYVLDEFERAGNNYCKSAMKMIQDRIERNPENTAKLMDALKGKLGELATKIVHSGTTDKYTSINTKSGYIEFRSPGNDWLSDKFFNKIKPTLMRFVVALDAAMDPEAYRQEYLKKLYKALTPKDADDTYGKMIKEFSEYVTAVGGAPEKVVADFRRLAIQNLKSSRLEREAKKGSGKTYWWKVSRPGYFASIEVVAGSKEEAIDKAVEPGNYPDWARDRNTLRAIPLRPYEGPTPTPAANDQGNWGIWMQNANRFARAPGQIDNNVLRRFPSREAAEQFLAQTRAERPDMRTDIEVREIPIPGSTMDRAMQRAAQAGTFQEPSSTRGDLTPRGPGPWEIYRLSDGESVRELEHTSRPAAESEARSALGLRALDPVEYGVRTRGAGEGQSDWDRLANRLNNNTNRLGLMSQIDVENALGWGSQFEDANYEIVCRMPRIPENGEPVFRFIANTQAEAWQKFAKWLEAQELPDDTEDYGFKAIGTSGPAQSGIRGSGLPPPASEPSSYELYRRSDGRTVTAPAGNPIQFLARDPADAKSKIFRYVNDFNLPGSAAEYGVRSVLQPPATATSAPQARDSNGIPLWSVLRIADGQIVHVIAANTQSEASREALSWLRDRGEENPSLRFKLRPAVDTGRTTQPQQPAPTQTRTVPGQPQQTFTGEWDVVMGGEVVFRVRGENQGVANQAARQWILGRSREFLHDHQGQEVEVVPRYA